MSKNFRIIDYLEHMQQAAFEACSFVEGLAKIDFLEDRRTQQAVVMNLIIIGEVAAKLIENHSTFVEKIPTYRGIACVECAIVLRMAILILTLMWSGKLYKRHFRNYWSNYIYCV